jgi:hypothetical protein
MKPSPHAAADWGRPMHDGWLLILGALLGAGGVGLGAWLQARRTPPHPDAAAVEAAVAAALERLAPAMEARLRSEISAGLARSPSTVAAAAAVLPPADVSPLAEAESTVEGTPPAVSAPAAAVAPAAAEAPVTPAPEPPPPAADAPTDLPTLLAERRHIHEQLDALETRRAILPPDVYSRRRVALYAQLETLAAREHAARNED